MEPVGHQALGNEASGEAVDGKERREPGDDALRAPEAQAAGDPVVRGVSRRRLDPRTDAAEDHDHRQPDDRVADDDRPVRVHRGQACRQQPLAEEARAQRPERGGDVAGEVVPGEGGCSAGVGRRLAERRLLDREERPDLVAGRADDAPIVAARISSGTQLVAAKTAPATTMRSDPATRTRRRPIRSARVVSQSEISVSPTSVRVRIAPIVTAFRPRAARYSTSTTARKP
jgi:hypothetical protein